MNPCRPRYSPERFIGPVSLFVRKYPENDQPYSACSWIGDYCVAEWDGETVYVADPHDEAKTIEHDEKDGEDAVNWMHESIEAWLGAVAE